MSEELEKVEEFHRMFDHPVLNEPNIDIDRAKLRLNLILEELCELASGFGLSTWFSKQLENKSVITAAFSKNKIDKIEQLDALCDLMYVLNGTVLEAGFKDVFEKAFEEVHNSNMSKATSNELTAQCTRLQSEDECRIEHKKGRYFIYRNDDNKIIKPLDYQPANLKQFIK